METQTAPFEQEQGSAPEQLAEIGPRPEAGPVVDVEKAAKTKRPVSFERARVFDVETTDLHDAKNSVRYTARVDAPGKDKVYRRTFKFVVPEADRLAFLDSRSKQQLKFTTEDLINQYRRYRKGEPLKIEDANWPNWYRAYLQAHKSHLKTIDWLFDDEFKEHLESAGYVSVGENEWERPATQSVEQEIAGMLKENNFDLSPKAVRLEQSLGKAKDKQIAFNVDHRSFKYPLQEVKNRVEMVLGLLKEGVLTVVEKYRAMPFSEILKIKEKGERELAIQALAIFAGIPTKALKLADAWVKKNRDEALLKGYESVKARQQDQNLSGRTRRGKHAQPPESIFIFETLGLRLRSGTDSFATEASQQALVKRLHREPITHEETKDSLDVAQEFVSGLNLARLGFKGLQKKIDTLDADDKQKGMVYLAASLEAGYTPRGAVDNLTKKNILGPISELEVFRTSARIALELMQQKAKDPKFIEPSDSEYFDKSQEQVFKDSGDRRQGAFVAKRRVQAGTGAQFVDVAIIRQAGKGEEDRRDRVFHLPVKNNAIVGSVSEAKELRAMVSAIFLDRQQAGQRLSFVPHIELLKSAVKTNPKFRLSLGTAQAEVDYKSLYGTLSFQNKVEAELVKAVYLDSKKADAKAWAKLPDWKKQAVYKFQDIVSHSGLPSLTEQLLIEELSNRLNSPKAAAPILGKDRAVVKTGVKKTPAKAIKSSIRPIASVNPEALAQIEAGEKKTPAKKSAKKKK